MTPVEQQLLLDRVRGEARRLASIINAPLDALLSDQPGPNATWVTLYWREAHDGDDRVGWYLALMRNEDGIDWELSEVAADPDPINVLYAFFDELAGQIARTETVPQGDRRAEWFAKQEALLGRLREDWRARTSARHAAILGSSPTTT